MVTLRNLILVPTGLRTVTIRLVGGASVLKIRTSGRISRGHPPSTSYNE